MPDLNSPEPENGEKRPFIREKIARPPLTRGQLMKRMAACLLLVAFGGCAAGASFAVVRPLAERYLSAQSSQESIPVTIPKDDPEIQETGQSAPIESTDEGEITSSETDSNEETGTETETSIKEEEESRKETESKEEIESEEETEPEEETTLGKETESKTEEETLTETERESWFQEETGRPDGMLYGYTVKDLNDLYDVMRDVVQEADKGIVEVHSVKQEMDWFDNPVENAGLYAGAVIAITDQELLILTPDEAVEHADSIKVTFSDGSQADGTIKQMDTISGMAVVSVASGLVSEDTFSQVSVLRLGNSYSMRQGDLVAALGAPAGMVHSSTYGSISYVAQNVQVADGITRLLYADIKSNPVAGTFLVNMGGEVVGWVTDAYEEENTVGMTVAMAISDYKSVLEKMFNGYPVPYLGICGQEVSREMTFSGIPIGVYVTECILDGPAYNAGIQNGDIIVRIGGKNIFTMQDYQREIEALNQNEVVTVMVQRWAVEEYKELEYQVTVGAR